MTRFGTYDTPKMPVIPTFLQYLKTANRKGVENKTKFPVEIIWLPGKFDNVTLQTHAFRYVASPNNPLYGDIIDYADECWTEEATKPGTKYPRLEIVILDFDAKTIAVTENDKKLIVWEPLGANALKAN